MTEQHPGGVPEDFDAFHRPPSEPPLDQTMVFATVPGEGLGMGPQAGPGPEFGIAPAPAPEKPGLKQRITGLGKARLAVAGVVAAAVIGGGAWAATAATASPSNGQPTAAGPTTGATSQVPGKGGKAAKPGKNARAVRVAITQIGANTFTGTDAKGAFITVAFGDRTKFGNKQHPLSADKLTVGMTVTVMGTRAGDTVTATSIAESAKGKNPAKPSTPETSNASPAEANG